MTALEIFHNAEFELNVQKDGDSFRVLAPGLARALGHRTGADLARSLPEAEKGYALVHTPGGDQRVLYVTEAGFYRSVGQRQLGRIKDPETRGSVQRFQDWVFSDVIPAIRRDGGYIRPDASHEQLVQLADRAAAQARVLTALSGIVDPKWLEAKARHVAARALGEEPEVEFDSRPLTVGEYLEEQGVPARLMRRVSGNLGKKVKALYRAEHGVDPPTVDRFIDGALRAVASYTESDRHLMERAWSQIDADTT